MSPDTQMVESVDDFLRALNDHITARVRYDRDGARYAGENPPDEDEIAKAFMNAVADVVRATVAAAWRS